MDFIDPEKQRRHNLRMVVGYGLIAVAIVLTTLILLFFSKGYGFGKNGQVIQNGLVFVSSQPNPAHIYLNNTLNKATTNSRLELPAGQYTLRLTRNGYRPWVRALGVEGGSVEHFDYPFLFPTSLVTTSLQQYTVKPALVTQSPDRRWLLISQPGSSSNFYEYDLNNQKNLASTLTTISLPTSLLTASSGAQSWKVVEWSTDSRHVLLQHLYHGGSEYIMLDRQTPSSSVNLTKALKLNTATSVSLYDKNYNQYYLLDSAKKTLSKASLASPESIVVLRQVLGFKANDSSTILYVTTNNAPAGKVEVAVLQGSTTYPIQAYPTGGKYLLNITQYSNSWYVAAGDASQNKVYIYKNPMTAIANNPDLPVVPAYILKVNQPNYLEFSDNTQFIVAEGGKSFAVYDAENAKGYAYTINVPVAFDQHATWMDGDRLTLAANGNVIVFDYDDANQQTLVPAVTGGLPLFDRNYKWMYTLAPAPKVANSQKTQAAKFDLNRTALLIPADQ